jgi:hypothetical protein
MQFVSLTFCVTSCARATSMARMAWVSMLLTAISRYQPTHDLRDAVGVVCVSLVDLKRQRGFA